MFSKVILVQIADKLDHIIKIVIDDINIRVAMMDFVKIGLALSLNFATFLDNFGSLKQLVEETSLRLHNINVFIVNLGHHLRNLEVSNCTANLLHHSLIGRRSSDDCIERTDVDAFANHLDLSNNHRKIVIEEFVRINRLNSFIRFTGRHRLAINFSSHVSSSEFTFILDLL